MAITYRIALIGFGNVGQGFVEILRDRGKELSLTYGADFQIVAINTIDIGTIINPEGLDLTDLLQSVQNQHSFKGLKGDFPEWDAVQTIINSNADVIVELSFTNLQTGQPAITHVETAFVHNKDVVTTNKGPVALDYTRLHDIAFKNGLYFGVEGTVMSGTPSIHLGLDVLKSAGIRKVQGIFNGTTNYILGQMENGISYENALQEAQGLGYAEADPTGDVEGFDAAGKVVILANLLMGANLSLNNVDRTGITRLTKTDILDAKSEGTVWKLVGEVTHQNGETIASVKPTLLPRSHPLANVNGVTNAVTFTTDLLGEVTLIGPGAGRLQTGYAVLSDLLWIHRQRSSNS